MPQDVRRASKRYGTAQTVLLALFAAVFLLDPGPPLFESATARAVGLALCSVGILLMFSALLTIRRAVQVEPSPKRDAQLVTHGLYGYIRHPIYTSILVLVPGLCLRKPTLVVAAAGVVVVVFLLVKVRFEEALLLDRYPAYAAYRRRTWGVVPGLGRAKDETPVDR